MIKITVKNLGKLSDKFGKLRREFEQYLNDAGLAAMNDVILRERGTPGNYPPDTIANRPHKNQLSVMIQGKREMPYYIRGRGTQYPATRNRGSYNAGNSERLGTRYDSESSSRVYARKAKTYYVTTASYAPYVVGSKQSAVMARIGWRKILDVAQSKVQKITEVYQKFINRAIKDAGL